MVIGQTSGSLLATDTQPIKTRRSLPTYSASLPQYKLMAERKLTIDGREVVARTRIYPPENYVVEIWSEVPDVFADAVAAWRDQLITIAEKILRREEVLDVFKEEYTVYCVDHYRQHPERYLTNREKIVSLIKSEPLVLAEAEIASTLQDGSLQYAKDDLTIVDWDGAFVFDPQGDWQETIDLLEVANVHLLRLRVLDRQLDERLESVSKLLQRVKNKNLSMSAIRKQMADLLTIQVRSIEEFSHSARDIQLIGDWYAAKLYTLISRKFHLDEWRASLRDELDNLQHLYQTAAENFGVSTQTRAENIQLVLWFVLLLGYVVIFFLDWRKAIGN